MGGVKRIGKGGWAGVVLGVKRIGIGVGVWFLTLLKSETDRSRSGFEFASRVDFWEGSVFAFVSNFGGVRIRFWRKGVKKGQKGSKRVVFD